MNMTIKYIYKDFLSSIVRAPSVCSKVFEPNSYTITIATYSDRMSTHLGPGMGSMHLGIDSLYYHNAHWPGELGPSIYTGNNKFTVYIAHVTDYVLGPKFETELCNLLTEHNMSNT